MFQHFELPTWNGMDLDGFDLALAIHSFGNGQWWLHIESVATSETHCSMDDCIEKETASLTLQVQNLLTRQHGMMPVSGDR